MKKHVVFHGCIVWKTKSGLSLTIEKAELLDGPRGDAASLNPSFVKGSLYDQLMQFQQEESLGQKLPLGDLHVGVGAMPIFDGSQFQLIDFSGTDIKRINNRYSEPKKFAFTVFRGWGAPRTYGVTEGGAAGIYDLFTHSVANILEKIACEVQEELGLLATDSLSRTGWVAYRFPEIFADDKTEALEKGKEVWGVYHEPITYIEAHRIKKDADSLSVCCVDGHQSTLDGIYLAFERENATAEVSGIFGISLSEGFLYRPIDKEKNLPKPRGSAVVCFTADPEKDFVLPFFNGQFLEGLPGIPIASRFLTESSNTKFQRLYKAVRDLV